MSDFTLPNIPLPADRGLAMLALRPLSVSVRHTSGRMPSVQQVIDQLGTQLVLCPDSCVGISRDPNKGILPRSLFLERAGANGRGSLAVGLNPGTSKDRERAFYLDGELSYDRVKAYRTLIAGGRYFVRVKNIIDQLGLSGPILWSNLAKYSGS